MTLDEYIAKLQTLAAEGHGAKRIVKEYDSYADDLDEADGDVGIARIEPAAGLECPVWPGEDGFENESLELVVCIRP